MSRITAVSLTLSLCLALVAGVAHAQLTRLVGPERQDVLYDGDLDVDSGGVHVTGWGSGKAESVYEATYVGPEVLKVTSQGPYQGVVLRFARPADVAEFLASGAGYIDLRVQPAQTRGEIQAREQAKEEARARVRTTAGRGGGGARAGGGGGGMRGGGGGGMGGGGGGGMRGGGGGMRGGGGGMGGGGGGGMRGGGGGMRGGGGGMRGGGGGMGGGGGGGMRGGGGARGGAGGAGGARAPGGTRAATRTRPSAAGTGPAEEKVFLVKGLRVVIFTDQGPVVADSVPVGVMPKDKQGWTPVAIPLSQFRGVEGAKSVRAVGIFSDQSDVFYLGRVALLIDRRPVELTVEAEPGITRINQIIDFSVELRGGPVNPEISWDFDESNGMQQQAVGPKVKYIYKAPGDYIATCTVRDRGGVQPDTVKSVGVRVEGAA